jgi:two-component sensor histidine kinase
MESLVNVANTQTERIGSMVDDESALLGREPNASRFSVSVRMLLILLVMLVVIPAWGFAGYVAAQYALTERNSITSTGRTQARALASSLNFRLRSLESAMAALALSSRLRTGDLDGFYVEAQALAKMQDVAVALVAPDGRQLLNTGAPHGALLPPAAIEARYAEAIRSGTVQYSSLIRGNVSNRWLMSVAVPVIIENEARYALVVGAPSVVQWGEVLDNLELPAGWAAALIDDKNIIAARRPSPELHVGKPAHPSVVSLLTPVESGTGVAVSIDDRSVHVFFHRLKRAPWTVLVGVPSAEIDSSVWDEVSTAVLGGLVLLLVTILAAWLIARQFTTELIDVAKAAMAFRTGQNRVSTVAPSRIRELSELKVMLDSAIAGRNRYESQLKGLIDDKELLMQEVHHRVKNSLQLVRGILSLQARSATHPEAKSALNDAATRILTVADVHQHLYQGLSTAQVNIQQYLADLASDLTKSMLDHSPERHVRASAPHLVWPSEKTIALGIIVTELVTNAIKYGDGPVTVSLTVDKDQSATLIVDDEGKGFSEDFRMGNGGGLGSKLIASLVRQDEGSVRIDRTVPHGRVVVTLFANWRNVISG